VARFRPEATLVVVPIWPRDNLKRDWRLAGDKGNGLVESGHLGQHQDPGHSVPTLSVPVAWEHTSQNVNGLGQAQRA
jgi:hypothetical protein